MGTHNEFLLNEKRELVKSLELEKTNKCSKMGLDFEAEQISHFLSPSPSPSERERERERVMAALALSIYALILSLN